MKKILTTLGLLFTLTMVFAPMASAQVQLNPDLHPEYAPAVILNGPGGKPVGPSEYGNYYLQLFAGGLLYLAAPVAVLVIAIGGLRYVTAHGEQNALEGAKKTLVWAVIGLLVVMFAYAGVRIIISTTIGTAVPPAAAPAAPAAPPAPPANPPAGP